MIASVCKGKQDRFYWVVWENYAQMCEIQSIDTGYATSREAAWQAVASQFGDVEVWADKYAKEYRTETHRATPKKHKLRPPCSVSSSTEIGRKVDYLYSFSEAIDGQGEDSIRVHRVTRVTPKFIFVERLPCGEWTPETGVMVRPGYKIREYPEVRRFDRAEVERNGFAYIPKWYEPNLYLDPHVLYEQHFTAKLPACAKVLGLRPRFTVEQVKTAFRTLAKQLHPDAGGDAQKFIELQRSYELALAMAVMA